MSMPQIPENIHRPTFLETVIDLLESIALEEISLSHIINAEAEKMQAFVGKDLDFPTAPSNHDIMYFDKIATGLLDTVIMKEWLLYKKLQTVLEVLHKGRCYIKEELDDNCGEGNE